MTNFFCMTETNDPLSDSLIDVVDLQAKRHLYFFKSLFP